MIEVVEPTFYWPETTCRMWEYLLPHVERCGRICYKSEDKITDKSAPKFVENICRNRHESVLEHSSLTAIMIGSRAFSHQLVRHRIGAYCVDGEAETILSEKSGNYKRRTIASLFKMKKTSHGRSRLKLVKINCMDETTGSITQGRVRDVIYTGKKPCIEIEITGGYTLNSTEDHLYYTPQGWERLEDVLALGLKVAINGKLEPSREWLEEEYRVKNRARKDIAANLGVSDSWLGKIIAKHGLQKPCAVRPNKHSGHGVKGMFSAEQRAAISKRMSGPNSPHWKGGVTKRGQQLRADKVTPELRKQVYERDDYTCRLCHTRGGKLTLHHVVPVWQNEDLIDEPKNLVTLCRTCHHKVNGHEHEFADYFAALEPVKPCPKMQAAQSKKMAHFADITAHRSIGAIDTYDIVMSDPHHNFVANGVIVHNSQESMRFVNYGKVDALKVICPKRIGLSPGVYKGVGEHHLTDRQYWWITHQEACYTEYLRELEDGIPPEDARYSLPISCKTEVAVTYNLRQWRHFLRIRTDSHAQWEIRDIATAICKQLKNDMPAVFCDILMEDTDA